MTKLIVKINGTDVNPWHKMDLERNPFPQIPGAELMTHMDKLNRLGAEPIKSVVQIREILQGFSKEFIDLCCAMYKPGVTVTFIVTFDRKR